MRIFLAGGGTGGHLYPALAIARALQRAMPEVQPLFIGSRRGIEREILPTSGFPFELIDLRPLDRARPWNNVLTAYSLAAGVARIRTLAREQQPRLVVATGGYAAGAAIAYAAAARIPLVLQEQNSFAGKTIRLGSRFAREIHLGFPEAARSFPPRVRVRCVATGNPIEAPPPQDTRPTKETARQLWGLPTTGGLVLLIFGGSQGSAALNELAAAWLGARRSKDLHVIWATGQDHFQRYRYLTSENVVVRPYLAPIGDAYAAADLALTRSGAMTTAELCAWGIPAILVPLPTAAADHQTANARALERAGVARLLEQHSATPPVLEDAISRLVRDAGERTEMTRRALERARPDAAHTIARRLLRVLGIT
ncbi:MAG: undecaprenyldiphospho-muramoylpentapeptide beta-N-acetylglucosaminyltransferase [Gemmatimonadaceae bacterium]